MDEELLGLPLEDALAKLQAAGVAPYVTFAAAPLPPGRPGDPRRTCQGEEQGLASTRVIAVRDGGRELVVSRFLVGDPS